MMLLVNGSFVGSPNVHSWGKCTMTLMSIDSDYIDGLHFVWSVQPYTVIGVGSQHVRTAIVYMWVVTCECW